MLKHDTFNENFQRHFEQLVCESLTSILKQFQLTMVRCPLTSVECVLWGLVSTSSPKLDAKSWAKHDFEQSLEALSKWWCFFFFFCKFSMKC